MHPLNCVYFALFALALQQFDGNITFPLRKPINVLWVKRKFLITILAVSCSNKAYADFFAWANFVENKVLTPLLDKCSIKRSRRRRVFIRGTGILITAFLFVELIYMLVSMLISQIIPSVQGIIDNFDSYSSNVTAYAYQHGIGRAHERRTNEAQDADYYGGLLGVFGMIVGVPIFAVIYAAVRAFVNTKLDKKHLPKDTNQYESVEYIR